ncbi:MAG TPA: hypothetical protein VKD90_15875 [Gemmataceae bacterium]|nr:hypothetical protein [Gemmataceae bacterium]
MTGTTRARWRRKHRAAAFWLLGAFVASQVALAVWIDQHALSVRDPEYVLLEGMLRDRMAEAPGQPSTVFVGSSRVAHGFNAARARGANEVVVFNFGVPGSGPYFQTIMLDRMAASGLRTDVLFLELLHPFYNAAAARSLDHSLLDGARLSYGEAVGLLSYGERSKSGPLRRWFYARALPIRRHQAELRDLIGLDEYRPGRGPPSAYDPIDPFGYRPWLKDPKEWAELTALAHRQYDPFYADFRLDSAPWGRMLATIDGARSAGTAVVVVLMPEGSEFRGLYSPTCRAGVEDLIRRLRDEVGVPVVDGRDWLPDSAFYDQHHLKPDGAKAFADRFRTEALEPALARLRRHAD